MKNSKNKIAIVETRVSRNDYTQLFEDAFDYDLYQLCSDPNIKKVLKRHCDIKIDLDVYDWIVLIGSDAVKFFTKLTSVTTYTGKCVENKFLPIINPAMLVFKPEAIKLWEFSKNNIISYIRGEIKNIVIDDKIAMGIRTTKEAYNFIKEALDYPLDYIALDSETTGLFPRDGWMQGFSICYDGKKAAYIITDCITSDIENLLQELFKEKIIVFHNAKFDIAFFKYHFGFKFYRFEDTMLLHYLIDENPGGHGLKELAMKHTLYGDYEKPLRDWCAAYRRKNNILLRDFDWACIPFEVMYPYAAMDALCTFILYEKLKVIREKNKRLISVYDRILIPGTLFLIDIQDLGS